MEQLEKDVIKLLKQNGRMSAGDIAKATGSDEKTVAKTITALEKRGVILGYTALVDDGAVGGDYVEALIEVKVNPMYGRGFDAIAEDIYKFDKVKSFYLMIGGYDLCVLVEGKNLREVASFVSEELSVMDKVLSTATHFILKKYKIGGELTVPDKRQVITP